MTSSASDASTVSPAPAAADPGTPGDALDGASDYSSHYYAHYKGPAYDPAEEHWQRFFGGLAERIVQILGPESALDAGCAMGILVGNLRERGVDASGIDVSEYAIAHADQRAVGHVRVGDLLKPLERRYDLITCIEVLEHLEAGRVEEVIASFCASTDRVLLSTTPEEFNEATHINVRPPSYWAALFADHGFYRRFDVDASFVTPWAVVFERRQEPARRLVSEYETVLWDLRRENRDTRRAVIERERRLAGTEGAAEELARYRTEADELRTAVMHDRARLELAENEARTARAAEQAARQKLAAITASTSYRMSRRLARSLKRVTRWRR